jgi:hypothetical protein
MGSGLTLQRMRNRLLEKNRLSEMSILSLYKFRFFLLFLQALSY